MGEEKGSLDGRVAGTILTNVKFKYRHYENIYKERR